MTIARVLAVVGLSLLLASACGPLQPRPVEPPAETVPALSPTTRELAVQAPSPTPRPSPDTSPLPPYDGPSGRQATPLPTAGLGTPVAGLGGGGQAGAAGGFEPTPFAPGGAAGQGVLLQVIPTLPVTPAAIVIPPTAPPIVLPAVPPTPLPTAMPAPTVGRAVLPTLIPTADVATPRPPATPIPIPTALSPLPLLPTAAPPLNPTLPPTPELLPTLVPLPTFSPIPTLVPTPTPRPPVGVAVLPSATPTRPRAGRPPAEATATPTPGPAAP